MSSEGSAGEQRAETAPAYKSTPLRPAIIMTTVLVWALVVALIVRVPAWASIFLAVLTGASFLAFLGGVLIPLREGSRVAPHRPSAARRARRKRTCRGEKDGGLGRTHGSGRPGVVRDSGVGGEGGG
jgi:hypothetical protein